MSLRSSSISCAEVGVSRLASVSGDIDLSTHDGQLIARILGAMARKESDDKSRRVTRKHQELARAGKVSGGGTRPYGYEADRRTVVEAEAVVIRELADRALAGEAVRALCRDLDERGLSTVTGVSWKPWTLTRLLMSGRISGQREHRGAIVAEAEWPGIIAPQQTAQLRRMLSDASRRTNQAVRRYPLVRLLRCGLCGATLVSRPKKGGARRYICATGPGYVGCGHICVLAEPLEAFVVQALLDRLDSPELAAALSGADSDPDAVRLRAEIADSQAQLETLAAMYGDRAIGLQEWAAARTPIDARIKDAERQLGRPSGSASLDGFVGNAAGLRDRWEGLPLHRQHAIVAAVLEHLVVGPGRRGFNGFDPSRFRPIWRV